VFIKHVVQEEIQVGKLSREVVERLLWRPEDTPDRLEHSIQQYSTNVLPLVEVKILHFVPLHLIIVNRI